MNQKQSVNKTFVDKYKEVVNEEVKDKKPSKETYNTKYTKLSNTEEHNLVPSGTYYDYPYAISAVDNINSALSSAISWAKTQTAFKNATYVAVNNPQDQIPLIIDYSKNINYNTTGNSLPVIRSYISTNYRSLNSNNERNSEDLKDEYMQFYVNYSLQTHKENSNYSRENMKQAFYKAIDTEVLKQEGNSRSYAIPYNLKYNFKDKIETEIVNSGLYEYDYLKDMENSTFSSGEQILPLLRELYTSKIFLVNDSPNGSNQFNIYNNRVKFMGFDDIRFNGNIVTDNCTNYLKTLRNEFSTVANRIIEAGIGGKLTGDVIKKAFIGSDGGLRRFGISSLILPRILRQFGISTSNDMSYLIPHLESGTWINPWSNKSQMKNEISKTVSPTSMPKTAYLPNDSGLTIKNSAWMYPFQQFSLNSNVSKKQTTMVDGIFSPGNTYNMISKSIISGGDYSDTLPSNFKNQYYSPISTINNKKISATTLQTLTSMFLNSTKRPLSVNKYLFLTLNGKNEGESSGTTYCAGNSKKNHWCTSSGHKGITGPYDIYSWEFQYYDVLNSTGSYQYCNGLNGLGELDQSGTWHNNSCSNTLTGNIWDLAKIHGGWKNQSYWNNVCISGRRGNFYVSYTNCVNAYGKKGQNSGKICSDRACKGMWTYYHYKWMSESEATRVYNQANGSSSSPKWFSTLHTYSDESGKCRTFGSGNRYSYLGNFAKEVLKLTLDTTSITDKDSAANRMMSANYIQTSESVYRIDDRILFAWKDYLIKSANVIAKKLSEEIYSFYIKNPLLLLPFRLNTGYLKFIRNKVFTNNLTTTYYNVECPFTPTVLLNCYSKALLGNSVYVSEDPLKEEFIKTYRKKYSFNGSVREFIYKLFDGKVTKNNIDTIYKTLLEEFAFVVNQNNTQENLKIPYIKIKNTNNPQDYLNNEVFTVGSVNCNEIDNLEKDSIVLLFDLSKLSSNTTYKFSDNETLNTALKNSSLKETISITTPLIFVHRNNGNLEFVYDSGSTSGNVQLRVWRNENSTNTSVGVEKYSSFDTSVNGTLNINKTFLNSEFSSMTLPSMLKSRFQY